MTLDRNSIREKLAAKKRSMFHIEHGDNLEILKKLSPNSFDSLVTDPPSGIAFMGKDWDTDKGGRDAWIAWLRTIMQEVYRVLKPGGYGVVWSLPRTSHWTAMALEDAGFDIRDSISHVFGQGFPKSHDISKAIDRLAGAEREIKGHLNKQTGLITAEPQRIDTSNFNLQFAPKHTREGIVSQPLSDPATAAAAAKWNGWGSAVKPAHEIWWLIQKPISENSIAENVLTHGVGGLNIDGSRIGWKNEEPYKDQPNKAQGVFVSKEHIDFTSNGNPTGRFPSNFLMTHSPECELIGNRKVGSGEIVLSSQVNRTAKDDFFTGKKPNRTNSTTSYGTETVENWQCSESCPIRILDEQSGGSKSAPRKAGSGLINDLVGFPHGAESNHSDKGGASRFFKTFEADLVAPFFYAAKPSSGEKNKGLEGRELTVKGSFDGAKVSNTTKGPTNALRPDKATLGANGHPTVKGVKLMQYLITLITPPSGVVLDPFMGSGTTGVAAIKNGFKFFGIDQEKQYTEIAIDRLMGVYQVDPKMFKK